MASKKKNNNKTQTTELNSQSIQHLGLSKQPFMSEILSDEAFYKIPALEKISDNLIHQVQFSDLLLIVEGLQGSGKTALFRRLIQSNIQNIKLLSIQAEATDTLVQVQQKMSLHMQDLGDANHLDDNLKSLQMFDQTPLVIMDNSHVLSDITLQELFRYQQQLKSEHEVTLKILLFANTGMAQTLQNISDIQPDQMYVQHIPEFNAKQAHEFIMHRLASAGYNGEPLFDESEFELLLKKSIGTPSIIMRYAAPAIDKIVNETTHPPTSSLVKTIIIFSFVIGLAGAATGYLYFSGELNFAEEDQTETPALAEPADVFITEADETDEPEALEVIPPINEASVDIEEATDAESNTLEAEQGIKTFTKEEITEPEELTAEMMAPHSPIDPPVEEIEPQMEITNPAPLIEKESEIFEPEAIEAEVIKPAPIKTPVIKEKPIAAQKIVQPEPIQQTATLHPALKKLNVMGTNNVLWIKQQSSRAWTMQLLGAREPATLLKFVRKHRLGTKVAWYKTDLKGAPYYVLIHGSYPSRDTARASITNLSPQLRALKPWVKSMKSVQQAIK